MIQIEHLNKSFAVFKSRGDRLKEWLSFGKRVYHTPMWALRDINLTIPPGEVFGIIGMNGAGKSTLLKIMTGTMSPTSGSVSMQGRVAALLELGTGFHPDLTGRENVRVNGRILGLRSEEIEARLGDIEAFSELGSFFDHPVRTYSTGMYVRLGFALAASIQPDVLIIDEALSVGDAYFQQKCLRRIEAFKKQGVTIFFVSHDAGAVKLLCDRVAIMEKGAIRHLGEPQDMLELYNAALARREGTGQEHLRRRGSKDVFGKEVISSGNQKVEITSVKLWEAHREVSVEALEVGKTYRILVEAIFHDGMENPTVGILIRDRMGYDLFGTNTAELGCASGSFSCGEQARFIFSCTMNLGPGDYTLTVAAHSHKTHEEECYEWIDRILSFKVLPKTQYHFVGVSYLDPSVQLERCL